MLGSDAQVAGEGRKTIVNELPLIRPFVQNFCRASCSGFVRVFPEMLTGGRVLSGALLSDLVYTAGRFAALSVVDVYEAVAPRALSYFALRDVVLEASPTVAILSIPWSATSVKVGHQEVVSSVQIEGIAYGEVCFERLRTSRRAETSALKRIQREIERLPRTLRVPNDLQFGNRTVITGQSEESCGSMVGLAYSLVTGGLTVFAGAGTKKSVSVNSFVYRWCEDGLTDGSPAYECRVIGKTEERIILAGQFVDGACELGTFSGLVTIS